MQSSLVLAIEPDARQAAILKRVVHERTHADITVVDTKDAAIAAINARVPDLILVTALLSPRDEQELVAHLRTLDEDHLQTITIPLLATAGAGGGDESGGFFKAFRKKKQDSRGGVGCDPWAFADQVTGYLRDAADARAAHMARLAFERNRNAAPLSAPLTEARSQVPEARYEGGAEGAETRSESAPLAFEQTYEPPTVSGHAHATSNAADVHEPHTASHTQHHEDAHEKGPAPFNDPDYAFSWRTSEPAKETKKRKPEPKVGGPGTGGHVPEARHHGGAEGAETPSVILPPPPASPEPEPIVVAAQEPIVVAAPEPIVAAPEPIITPALEPVVEAAPKIEPIVRLEPEPIFAPEPAIAPEPIVAAAPEPLVIPEPVVEKLKPPKPAKPAKGKAAKHAEPVRPPKAPEPPPKPAPIRLRPLKRLPPLAMWARIDEPLHVEVPAQAPHTRHEDDDFAALMAGLKVPAHVLAVSYPRRPFIHRVRTTG